MRQSHRPVPPLSPVLLAGVALRPLPPALFQPVLGIAMAIMRRRHPGAFERLSGRLFHNFSSTLEPVASPRRSACFS